MLERASLAGINQVGSKINHVYPRGWHYLMDGLKGKEEEATGTDMLLLLPTL